MPNNKKITFEQLDQAVKASYQLGLIDGNAEKDIQLKDMRRRLFNMLRTNKELFASALAEQKQEQGINISPCSARGLLAVLRKAKEKARYRDLKRKYDKAMGKD